MMFNLTNNINLKSLGYENNKVCSGNYQKELDTPPFDLTNMTSLTEVIKIQNYSPRVLVVDDDVDSIIPVGQIFRKLGCETEQAIELTDAQKKINSGRSDIIILDWYLDGMTGGDLLLKIQDLRRRYQQRKVTDFRPKIITYTGASIGEVPLLKSNSFFEYIGHWQKPLKNKDLVFLATSLLNEYRF